MKLPTGEQGWLVSRYDDVVSVLKDERLVKDADNALSRAEARRLPWFRKVFKSLQRSMINQDPPNHTRLRGLVNGAFTPRLVEQMRPRIQQLTDELLDAVEPRGRMDLIHDYALPLPATIIAEVLGVPPS